MTTTPTGTAGASRSDDVPTITYSPARRAWIATNVSAARLILTNPNLFGTAAYENIGPDLADTRHMFLADHAHHGLLRRTIGSAFSARRIELLDGAVLTPAAHQAAAALRIGTVDLVQGFIAPYTRTALTGVVGLTDEEMAHLIGAYRVADRLQRTDGDRPEAAAAAQVLHDDATTIFTARATSPSEDAGELSVLTLARRHGWLSNGLSPRDLTCILLSLIEAAAVKTHRDATATTLRRIAAMPVAEQRRLRDQGRYRTAVEEALRLQRGGYLPRTVLSDCTLGSAHLATGELIQIDLNTVGTDPTMFADPFVFDPWRTDLTSALTFGAGPYRCIGQGMALSLAARACEALVTRGSLALAPADDRLSVELRPWSN